MKTKEFIFEIKKPRVKMPKQRDPNWQTMQAKATSGAGGQHRDEKRAEKLGDIKHKKDLIPMEQGVAEGSEQVYKVIAVDKNNALGKKVKLNVKANSVDEVFERLAMSDWYPLSINGVEVIDGKRLAQGVREASDFGEPREILEDVLQTLEREVEWPLTDVMDPKEVRQLLSPIVRAVNDKLLSMDRDGNQ
jgi:hypothetical protein